MAKDSLQLATFLPYRLSYTSNRVSEMIATQYEALFGLTIPEWRVVAVAAERGEITQQSVCAQTHMDKVTVSRAAIALVERGVLDRTPHPEDKRSHLLKLSKVGRDLYASIAPRALNAEQSIFSCLSAEERNSLMTLLGRLDARLDALDEK